MMLVRHVNDILAGLEGLRRAVHPQAASGLVRRRDAADLHIVQASFISIAPLLNHDHPNVTVSIYTKSTVRRPAVLEGMVRDPEFGDGPLRHFP